MFERMQNNPARCIHLRWHTNLATNVSGQSFRNVLSFSVLPNIPSAWWEDVHLASSYLENNGLFQ